MQYITPLEKPEIWLVGNVITSVGVGGHHQGAVDHSTYSYTYATNVIESKTILNKNDILTFDDSVRVIITGRVDPKPTYVRPTMSFSNLEYEGNATYNTKAGSSNTIRGITQNLIPLVAETYYTLNGADPRRQPIHLYNYTDLDDRVTLAANRNPSGPDDDAQDNIGSLGFVIASSPTGSDLITLKARTFYDGKVSPIAMVVFNLHRNSPTEIDNR